MTHEIEDEVEDEFPDAPTVDLTLPVPDPSADEKEPVSILDALHGCA